MIRRTPIRKKAKRAKTSMPWRRSKVRLDAKGMHQLRRVAFDRSEGYCENVHEVELAGETGRARCHHKIRWDYFDLHHVIHRSQGGSDEISNVACVCLDCHYEHHNGGPRIAPWFGVQA